MMILTSQANGSSRPGGLVMATCGLLILTCLALPTAAQVKCKTRISNCQCQTESGKYIDLSPLARPDDYRFKRVPGPSANWLYSYNPCRGFQCEGADNVAVCQNDKTTGMQEFALGTEDTAEFGYTLGAGLYVKYTSQHSSTTRVSLVSLICSQAGGTDEFRPTGDGTGVDVVTYTSQLTSRHACEVDSIPSGGGAGGGMSAGDVLLIVFFVGLVAYLVGGFAVNALLLKKGLGPASLPNVEFWLALPGFVVAGATFCWSRLRQLVSSRRSGYESAS